MQRARPYLKVAAVISAACLVAAFVAYRAGAFAPHTPPASTPADSTPLPDAQPAQAPTPDSPTSPVFMAGSKSTFVYDESVLKQLTGSTVILPPTPPAGTQSTSPANPIFLGGSKSLTPLFGPATATGTVGPPVQPAPPAPAAPKKDQ